MTIPATSPSLQLDRTHVLIVDDHALLAHSLAMALRSEGAAVTVAEVTTAEAALQAAADAAPDVVLLDLDLGAFVGDDLVAPLAAGGAHVIVVSGTNDRLRLAQCVERGASGLLPKSTPFDALLAAVRDAAMLQSLLGPQERTALLAELRSERAARRERLARFDRLTPREQQVLAALVAGKGVETIRVEWHVSEATVRTQIRGVLTKLGVRSQLAAVAEAHRAGWHPPEEDR